MHWLVPSICLQLLKLFFPQSLFFHLWHFILRTLCNGWAGVAQICCQLDIGLVELKLKCCTDIWCPLFSCCFMFLSDSKHTHRRGPVNINMWAASNPWLGLKMIYSTFVGCFTWDDWYLHHHSVSCSCDGRLPKKGSCRKSQAMGVCVARVEDDPRG